MNLKINDSIGKKIGLIIVLNIVGILFILLLSNVVFGLLAKVEIIDKASSKHNIGYYNGVSNFRNFTISENEKYFKKFEKSIDIADSLNGRFGLILEKLETMSPEETIEVLSKNDPGWNEKMSKTVNLYNLLKSNEIFKKLGKTAAKCHLITAKIKSLGKKYKISGSESEKKEIVNIVNSFDDQFEELVISFSAEMGELSTWLSSIIKLGYFIFCIILIFSISIIAFFAVRTIVKPLKKTVETAKNIAEGDFTQTIEVSNKDEVGVLADAFNSMVMNLNSILKDILNSVGTLSDSSINLTDISEKLTSGAVETSEKSNTVAVAAEEMNSNFNSVATSMEQSTGNVNMVASAVEEMASTISEIAQNSENASTITSNAVKQAVNASKRVNDLEISAKEIGNVTETINEISEQTNLLALNATIEAARAGDAGKGFAVVANEIKELARQTADATQEIKSNITGIQNSTSGAIIEIEQISDVINDVNELVGTIAAAVEEQSITTNEISTNISQVTSGIQEVSNNVIESSSVINGITEDISDVNSSAGEITSSSSNVNKNANDLSNLADELKKTVGKFKV